MIYSQLEVACGGVCVEVSKEFDEIECIVAPVFGRLEG